jgi:hypothetical protein
MYKSPMQAVYKLLDSAQDDESCSVFELVPTVARLRGRPIHVEEADLPPGTFGQWLATPDTDLIVLPSSAVNREITIAHEFGHMLLGHVGFSMPDLADSMTIAASSGLVGLVLRREGDGFDGRQELAAEEFARLLLDRLSLGLSGRATGIKARLADALR